MKYEMIDNFIDYFDIIKGKSKNTTKSYCKDLMDLHEYLTSYKVYKDTDFYKTIELLDLHKYMTYLDRNKGNKASTRYRKGIAIKEFFKYLKNIAKIITEDITENLELPKIEKRLPVYLTEFETNKLLNVVKDKYNTLKDRDTCIIIFFLTLGLRVDELVNIKLSSIKENVLRFCVKGNKERVIPIPLTAIEAYDKYLNYRAENKIVDQEYLFLSKNGKKMTESSINYMLKKYTEMAGIDKNITPHKMRHTAATLMKKNGVDISEIQKFLGHENISTTQIYAHVDDEELKESINKNPFANIKI